MAMTLNYLLLRPGHLSPNVWTKTALFVAASTHLNGWLIPQKSQKNLSFLSFHLLSPLPTPPYCHSDWSFSLILTALLALETHLLAYKCSPIISLQIETYMMPEEWGWGQRKEKLWGVGGGSHRERHVQCSCRELIFLYKHPVTTIHVNQGFQHAVFPCIRTLSPPLGTTVIPRWAACAIILVKATELSGLVLPMLTLSPMTTMLPASLLSPKSAFHIPLCPSSVCYELCCIPGYNKSMVTNHWTIFFPFSSSPG